MAGALVKLWRRGRGFMFFRDVIKNSIVSGVLAGGLKVVRCYGVGSLMFETF